MMKQNEKKVPHVEVGDLVSVARPGCNMTATEGIVVRNDADICVIDTCETVKVYESKNGMFERAPREVSKCVYVFGDLKPNMHGIASVTVTKL